MSSNHIYATMFISKPTKSIDVKFTEGDIVFRSILIGKQYYRDRRVCNCDIVIYKPLYNNNVICERPLEMFTSKVDKEKYPEVSQENRFELLENKEEY